MIKSLRLKDSLLQHVFIIIALLAIAPIIVPDYYVTVISSAIIFAIFALSLDLAWGYAGILNLGHSVFFGLGAYAFSIFSLRYEMIFVAVLLGILVPAILALIVSRFIFYIKSTPFFIGIVTLALAVIFEQATLSFSDLTGGQNGLTNIPSFPFEGLSYYYFLFGMLFLTFFIAYRITRSDFGKLVIATRDNEVRTEFLGFNIPFIRTLIFILSASLAGLAGSLFASFNGFVSPSLFAFVLAAQVIIWVAIGGKGTLIGAVIGALLINVMTQVFNATFPYIWQIILGLTFIIVVVFIPNGLYSIINKARSKKGNQESYALEEKEDKVVAQQKSQKQDSLNIKGMSVSFGSLNILKDLNLLFKTNEIQCIVGPNGAGKSTLINAITGHNSRISGEVSLDGRRLNNLSSFKIVKKQVARTFQTTSIIGSLTVAENLQLAVKKGFIPSFFKRTTDIPLTKNTLELVGKLGLDEKLHIAAQNLSHGDQQSLELCMVLSLEPKVLLLDEPTAGLTTVERREVGKLFKDLAHNYGLSLLIIEHDMDFVKEIADRVTVLHDGKIAADGTVEEITNSDLVKEIYLGKTVEKGGIAQ